MLSSVAASSAEPADNEAGRAVIGAAPAAAVGPAVGLAATGVACEATLRVSIIRPVASAGSAAAAWRTVGVAVRRTAEAAADGGAWAASGAGEDLRLGAVGAADMAGVALTADTPEAPGEYLATRAFCAAAIRPAGRPRLAPAKARASWESHGRPKPWWTISLCLDEPHSTGRPQP
jgi:hypothetical protein